jgi:hypothetical protein
VERVYIVNRNLIAGFDVAQREEDYVAVETPGERIWSARVIYVMGAIAAAAAIKTPAFVDSADAENAAFGSALRLQVRYLLARVLGDFPPAFEVRTGKATSAVDGRFLDR